jgi:hypothetical protein
LGKKVKFVELQQFENLEVKCYVLNIVNQSVNKLIVYMGKIFFSQKKIDEIFCSVFNGPKSNPKRAICLFFLVFAFHLLSFLAKNVNFCSSSLRLNLWVPVKGGKIMLMLACAPHGGQILDLF